MVASILRKALLCLVLGWGVAPLQSEEATVNPGASRPQITSLVIALEDGRSYALSSRELLEPKGGAIFWGDWAVANLLVPQYLFRPRGHTSAGEVFRLWFTAGESGELPAFLVHTPDGPVYPLDSRGHSNGTLNFPTAPRPQIARITVGYADGRVLALNDFALRDPKSGVMVWTDFAIANLLIPFYRSVRHLPTSPEDVMRLWHQPTVAPGRTLTQAQELPGFMVKPACIPSYPMADAIQ